MTPLLEVRNVARQFGHVQAIRRANLAVAAGQVVALLGDNGAGKSTLVKIIQGYHAPGSGTMWMDGQPIRFASPAEARDAGIETVPQDLGLVPLLSIYRNFFLGRELTRKPFGFLDHRRMRAICTRSLAHLGIQVRDPNEAVGNLSGGERQSIAIGRAEHFGARLVMLDEPTSALSVKQTRMVLDYIVEARARGLAILFITHNMAHAHAVADRITVMRQGRTVAEDLPGDEVTVEEMGRLVMGTLTVDQLAGRPPPADA